MRQWIVANLFRIAEIRRNGGKAYKSLFSQSRLRPSVPRARGSGKGETKKGSWLLYLV